MGRFDEIPGDAAVYEARNATFWLHDGLMFGRHLPDKPKITLEDAITVLQKLRELTGDRPVPFIFDGRGLSWLNMDARAYVRAHVPEVFSKVAVVVEHQLVMILSQAFLGIAGPEIPMRLFVDEDQAWEFVMDGDAPK